MSEGETAKGSLIDNKTTFNERSCFALRSIDLLCVALNKNMPFSKHKYPKNWREFSEYIRFERAKNKCEQCGAENYQPHPETGSKVVLTVAHLDGIGDICDCESRTGQKCANADHVLAMCQRDHLRYDIERHKFNARRSRAAARGQQWFADWDARFPQENT